MHLKNVKDVIDTVEEAKVKVFRRKKKERPNRKFHDGDVIEFYFEPDSLDICECQKVILIGIVTGVMYEKDGIYYKIQLRDHKSMIFGEMVIHETKINRKIE